MTFIRLIIISIVFSSCTDSVSVEKITGKYIMQLDTLELLENNTYNFYSNSTKNSGTWKLNSKDMEIVFDNFSFNPNKNSKGIWTSRIIKTNEKVRLNVNSDISNGYFEKIND